MDMDTDERPSSTALETDDSMQTDPAVLPSTTIVVAPTLPVQNSVALSALQDLFPAATEAPVAIVENLDDRALIRCLLIWNLPVYYLWENVMKWTKAGFKYFGSNSERR